MITLALDDNIAFPVYSVQVYSYRNFLEGKYFGNKDVFLLFSMIILFSIHGYFDLSQHY
jgi:hypothetical protein